MELKKETENFDLNKIKTLSPIEAKQYVDKYLIPLTDGSHAELTDGEYDIKDDAIIKRTYFKRMPNELSVYYFKEKTDLKTIIYDINKPVLYKNYLNLCPQIKQTYKKVEEFTPEIKLKLDVMLNYINEVLCSSNQDAYTFLLKWFSNMIRGNRNDSAIYLKGPQGIGKSTLLEFIRDYVLGKPLCYQGGSRPLKTHFNSALSGKAMVIFEELENFSASEWISISSVLKRQITSTTLDIERKGKEMREETNLNNYILISNNDAIQDDDGRRYFILPISTKYIGDKKYWDNVYSCFNDEVGQIFYSYLMDISLDGYNAQSYPITQPKLDSFSKRLDNVYKYLKDTFILTNKGIDRQTVQSLYDGYIAYCNKYQYKLKTKIDFNNALSDINIKWKKSNGQNVYQIKYDDLKVISDKFHWVHELDEIKCDNDDENDIDNDKLKNKCENQESQIKYLISLLAKHKINPDEKYLKEFINNEETITTTTITTTTKKINKMPPIIEDEVIEKKPKKKSVIKTTEKETDDVLNMLDSF